MKQFFLLLLTGSITCAALAQSKDETPFITRSLSGAGISSVEAHTTGGNITVTGVTEGEAKVEVFLRTNNGRLPDGSKEELQQRLDEDYTFTLTSDDHKLIVSAKRKSNNWNSKKDFSISFRIYVPQKVSAKLTTSGGNIVLTHLNGALEFTTSGGNLQLDDLAGNIKGMTSGGNIHVTNVSDDVKLTTSGGNVHVSKSKGKLNLSTSGGNVHLNDLDGKIDATTSGGNVDGSNISGDLTASTSGGNVAFDKLSCTLSASTSGGHLSIKIITLGTYVKLGNSGGNIDLQLPANKGLDLKLSGEKVKVNALTNFNGKVDDNHVEGSLNGGGVPVIITGRSSRVSVTLQ